MRNKFGNFCMVIGAALVFGALSLFLYNQQEANKAEQSSMELVERKRTITTRLASHPSL